MNHATLVSEVGFEVEKDCENGEYQKPDYENGE